MQLLQCLPGIFRLQQWTIAAVLQPGPEQIDTGVEIDNPALAFQQISIFGLGDNPAPRRYHSNLLFREFLQQACLSEPETGFALDIEYGTDGHPVTPFKFLVAIDETDPHATCEFLANRRFPNPHQADEINVLRRAHCPCQLIPALNLTQAASALRFMRAKIAVQQVVAKKTFGPAAKRVYHSGNQAEAESQPEQQNAPQVCTQQQNQQGVLYQAVAQQ